MRLSDESFLRIIAETPLVSIDLIIRNEQGQVLLGKRSNRPAQGFWFVPGGRILKGERIAEALERIATAEIGSPVQNPTLAGVFDHIYPDNFAGKQGVATQYVVIAYQCAWLGKRVAPDMQHSEMRWWTVSDLLADSAVHDNTKAYFR